MDLNKYNKESARSYGDYIQCFGDLLIGFYCKNDCDLKVMIEDTIFTSLTVKAGQFVYAINNESIIPIISVRINCKIYIDFQDSIDIIYGLLPDDHIRSYLLQNIFWTYRSNYNDYIVYNSSWSVLHILDANNLDNVKLLVYGSRLTKDFNNVKFQTIIKNKIQFPNMYSLLSCREK
jgi:hypothetical protein